MTLRVAVLASGRGSNMDSLLQAIESRMVDARIVALITDKPGAPCMKKAHEGRVPSIQALPPEPGEKRKEYDRRLLLALQDERPDLVVLAGFMRILTDEIVEPFLGRMINIHPAILPACKGAHGIRDTLAAGAKIAGATTHFVTTELDGGPIILQAALPVHEDDDQDSLAARVLELEHQLLPRTVQLFAENRIHVVDGRVRILDGPSWHDKVKTVRGALYSVGF